MQMVEEARRKGKVTRALNSTFIVLIPKKDKANKFEDFRPISLCNTLYKIISKTIAERLKHILSGYISLEQSGFLQNRSIHDAVTTT